MTYEETIELEKNVTIKNEADVIYNNFIKFVTLNVKDFAPESGRFTLTKDNNNATYLKVGAECFVYQCRFLNETYDLNISPSYIFNYIKKDHGGLGHLKSMVDRLVIDSIK